MHQALHIGEILEIILRYTSRGTDAACVRVCRTWHEPALDAVWYHVYRLNALLSLLGPMEQTDDGLYVSISSGRIPHIQILIHESQTFIQPHISPERWERFLFYAKRTHSLEYSGFRYGAIHPQSLATVAISRPFLHILPNLTHLTWYHHLEEPATTLMLSIPFMSPNLQSIKAHSEWDTNWGDKFPMRDFLRHIVVRSPHIQHLSLISDGPTSLELDAVLTNSISALYNLKTVLLSDTLLTANVVSVLSTCPHLEAIFQQESQPSPVGNSLPVLKNGAFPNLKEIHLQASLTSVIPFLRPPFPAAGLRWLSISTLTPESHGTISGFFETVGKYCTNIDGLELNAHLANHEDVQEPLPFAAVEPLLACKSLSSLSIDTPFFLNIEDTHLALMVSNWPRLRKLHLNPQPWPYPSHHIRLTFEIFRIFSRHCPDIEHLGVYIQPTIPTEPCGPLPKLQKLALGSNTVLYSVEDVAFFLTGVTPPTCTFAVEYSRTPPPEWVLGSALYESAKCLETAISLVPMMRKVDVLYRERLSALEGEIGRLTTSLE